eukprot:Protomagalhaensia_wolfi_Nauph_80__3623@NODE_365_length_2669_cov_99_481749_g275_i0_p1_GENE_NODE_365_length_2669_cov_99_481749_g275_i0NODE_365_length_2669_cov_99_481749_g275_i0_p1_ORF_typecomplete_len501_score72_70LCM/PF04072_14/9_8e25_NODE_365_length_2669_cov_99_481749_g275_i0691505
MSTGVMRGKAKCLPASPFGLCWWKALFFAVWDRIYYEVCIAAVRMAIYLQSYPVLNDLSRRLTFMSGNSDTNANLCLFLRQLYSQAPPPLRYDPQEVYFASMFLEKQYGVLSWMVTRLSWRLLPPLLRPLFKMYYGRARYASEFVTKCIEKWGVEQIVILGAGFDSNAYRSRERRIQREGKVTTRFIQVFEVDRPEVHTAKIAGLKANLSEAEIRYYTEGVTYVVCDFGVDSIRKKLLEHGFQPHLSTAVLWEGVTYYLERTALNATLLELKRLFSLTPPPSKPQPCKPPPTTEGKQSLASDSDNLPPAMREPPSNPSPAAPPRQSDDTLFLDATADTFSLSRESSTSSTSAGGAAETVGAVYLFLDYMLQHGTLGPDLRSKDRTWKISTLLANAIGTQFVTGFADAPSELKQYGWECIRHYTHDQVETQFFTNLPSELKVFEERNTTYGHNEPRLNCLECIFPERISSQWEEPMELT